MPRSDTWRETVASCGRACRENRLRRQGVRLHDLGADQATRAARATHILGGNRLSDLTPPEDFEKAVLVARDRLLGATVKECATQHGLKESEIRTWEKRAWWGAAQDRARKDWFSGLAGKSLQSLEKHVEKDGKLALQIAERLVPELAPAPQAVEVRSLLARLDVDKLPDWAIDRLANGESPVGVLMGMNEDERKAAGLIGPPVREADYEVEPGDAD